MLHELNQANWNYEWALDHGSRADREKCRLEVKRAQEIAHYRLLHPGTRITVIFAGNERSLVDTPRAFHLDTRIFWAQVKAAYWQARKSIFVALCCLRHGIGLRRDMTTLICWRWVWPYRFRPEIWAIKKDE